ncbi:MAG: peptidoglycan DD-metalloendopeptidase family protein [Clostridia bacterium]|nr:peptidoglycan DD-metalloendopeptidase family protein [Clostridia bacterium]
MKKGSASKQRKSLSIVFIPHSSSEVKVYKFTSFGLKVSAVAALLIFSLIGTAVFMACTLYENRKLKADIAVLEEENLKQNSLIVQKDTEISRLEEKQQGFNNILKQVTGKFREITETYLSSRSSADRVSRAGSRNEATFVDEINDLKALISNLEKAGAAQEDALADLSDVEKKLDKYMEAIPTVWPSHGRISSYFGGRPDPFTGRKKYHEGIDIAADYGTDIVAAAAGEIVFSGYSAGYGYNVVIDHGHGVTTLYGHCSKLLAKVGQKVGKGEAVAKVGSSGRSTGPHVHFEIRLDGTQVDPLKYLEK